MGAVAQTDHIGAGRVETKRLADDWIELKLFDANGEFEAIMELKPTYHGRWIEALLSTQAEIAADEASGEPERCSVLEFPGSRILTQALALLLLVA